MEEKLGTKYVEGRSIEFAVSYEESGPATPIFFILSPGVDPLKDVEALGRKLGFTTDNKNLHSVSLGQGQEVVAERALDLASKEGHWVVLQVSHTLNPPSHPEFGVCKFTKMFIMGGGGAQNFRVSIGQGVSHNEG